MLREPLSTYEDQKKFFEPFDYSFKYRKKQSSLKLIARFIVGLENGYEKLVSFPCPGE